MHKVGHPKERWTLLLTKTGTLCCCCTRGGGESRDPPIRPLLSGGCGRPGRPLAYPGFQLATRSRPGRERIWLPSSSCVAPPIAWGQLSRSPLAAFQSAAPSQLSPPQDLDKPA